MKLGMRDDYIMISSHPKVYLPGGQLVSIGKSIKRLGLIAAKNRGGEEDRGRKGGRKGGRKKGRKEGDPNTSSFEV